MSISPFTAHFQKEIQIDVLKKQIAELCASKSAAPAAESEPADGAGAALQAKIDEQAALQATIDEQAIKVKHDARSAPCLY